MKVKAKFTSVPKLGENLIKLYTEKNNNFDVMLGVEYVVYGVTTWKGVTHFLLKPENTYYETYPNWYPIDLFEVTDTTISPFWVIGSNMLNEGGTIDIIMGYRLLVESLDHQDGIVLREKEHLTLFETAKKDIDELDSYGN